MLSLSYRALLFVVLAYSAAFSSAQQFNIAGRRVDFEGPDQDENQVQNIQHVLGLLRERGLLSQVDPTLLNKAKNLIQTTSNEPRAAPLVSAIEVEKEPLSKSDLYRANRERILNGYYATRDATTEKPSLVDRRLNDDSASCQALRTENQLLKQMLNKQKYEEDFENGDSSHRILNSLTNNGALNVFNDHYLNNLQAAESNQSPVFSPSNPLEALLNKEDDDYDDDEPPLNLIPGSTKPRSNRNIDVNIETKSVLITPTPVVTTQYETSSHTTTVTNNVTKEIGIHFHGRKIVTHVIETSVEVKTTHTTLSNTMTITPTPSWSYYTVTHTPTVRNEIRPRPKDKIPFGGHRAEVVEIPESLDSFKSLTDILIKIKAKLGAPLPTLVPVESKTTELKPVGPTTSVMTIFLSGSKPGEFTTSLRTITLGAPGDARQKREALELMVHPSPVQPIHHTQLLELEDFFLYSEQLNDAMELESSMSSLLPKEQLMHRDVTGKSDDLYKMASTVTVTVTVTDCSL